MATVANELPIELRHPLAKERVILYLQELGLPSRYKRLVLQHWGAEQNVPLSGEDYTNVSKRKGEPTP